MNNQNRIKTENVKFIKVIYKFNPDTPMFLLFYHARISFPKLDVLQYVIKDILKLNIDYMLHESHEYYKYIEHYYLGDMLFHTS